MILLKQGIIVTNSGTATCCVGVSTTVNYLYIAKVQGQNELLIEAFMAEIFRWNWFNLIFVLFISEWYMILISDQDFFGMNGFILLLFAGLFLRPSFGITVWAEWRVSVRQGRMPERFNRRAGTRSRARTAWSPTENWMNPADPRRKENTGLLTSGTTPGNWSTVLI